MVAYGGGSAIDTGKAIAMLLANGGEALDYLEVVGRGRPIAKPSLPCIAVATTAGTVRCGAYMGGLALACLLVGGSVFFFASFVLRRSVSVLRRFLFARKKNLR